MKCILLLAAVYSLIIHQSNKEKGGSFTAPIPVKAAIVAEPAKNSSPVSSTVNTQFGALHAILKLNE